MIACKWTRPDTQLPARNAFGCLKGFLAHMGQHHRFSFLFYRILPRLAAAMPPKNALKAASALL